jgi:hypothetical protein
LVNQAREYIYSVRITDELRNALVAAARQTGVPHTSLVISGMESICRYIGGHGRITMPFELVPSHELKELKADSAAAAKPLSLNQRGRRRRGNRAAS